jgi:hypothetical protein
MIIDGYYMELLHIIVQALNTENNERILKTVKEKSKVNYKGKLMRIKAYFSTESVKT